VRGPDQRRIYGATLTLNDRGAFNASLILPETAVPGVYVITAAPASAPHSTMVHRFRVERLNVESVRLALAFDREVYHRGDVIRGTVSAMYQWGLPVPGRQLRCDLPDGRQLLLRTGRDGKADFEFDTAYHAAGACLRFTACIDGENVSVTDVVQIASQGFELDIVSSHDVVLADEPFDVTITTQTPQGNPSGVQ